MTKKTLMKLSDLVPNANWQTRHKLDEENVERLMVAFKSGATLLAILVRRIEKSTKAEIFDGFHRYEAATRLNHKAIKVEFFEGTEHEALTEGVTRNMQHGLQLIKEDMKRAARMLYIPSGKGGGAKKKGQLILGSTVWVGKKLGVNHNTIKDWIKPKREIYKEKYRNRTQTQSKLYQELGEEGVKELVLEKFGASALEKVYEPVVKWSMDASHPGSPGTPILFISDVHYGEAVAPEEILSCNEYSRKISERRLKHTFEMAATLLNQHLARPDYGGIVLILGGDMISGVLREEDLMGNEAPPLMQALDISTILSDGVAFLQEVFGRVTLYCVPGNHGRLNRKPQAKFYAATNLDWLVYKMIERSFVGNENVVVNAPPARDLNFVVAGHRYRLSHGDQFRGGDGIIGPLGPVIRGDVRKRVAAALMPGQPSSYDTMLVGHFHTLMMLPRLIMNGSVKGYDEFALSISAPFEPPQQALWTVHPDHGQTWYMPVLCDAEYQAHK